MLGVTAFLVGVAVWPWFIGFATTPRWAVLAVAVPLMCLDLRVRMTRGHALGLAFLGWATLSLAWSISTADAINELWKWLLLAGAFCVGAETEDLQGFWRGVGIAVAVSAAVVAAQLAGYSFVPQMAPPAGLFGNRIFLAEFAALALVGTVNRSWLALPAVFVLGTATSVGALFGVAAVASVWLWRRSQLAALIVPAVIVTTIVAASPRPAVETGFARHLASAAVRTALWLDVAAQIVPLGHGVGSYYVAEAQSSPRQQALDLREAHAHSDPLELLFEFGLGCLPLAGLLVWALGAPVHRECLVLVVFIASSLVGFPLHNPATAFVAAVVAGHLCGARHRIRATVAHGRAHGRFGPAASLVSPV